MLRIEGTATLNRTNDTKKSTPFLEVVNLSFTAWAVGVTPLPVQKGTGFMAKTIKPYRNKGECLQIQNDDLQAVTELCISSLKKHGGKQALYADTPQELQRFMNDVTGYFQMLHDANEDTEPDKQLYPSIEGLCLHMGFSRNVLSQYGKRSSEWREAIDTVRNAIATCKIQLASHFRIPPLVFVFDMTNNCSYYNTSEFRISTEPPQDTADTPRIPLTQLREIAERTEPLEIPEDSI